MLTTPIPNHKNYYDASRRELTWRVTIMLIITYPILAITLFVLDNEAKYIPFFGIALALIGYVLLRKKMSYQIVSKTYIIGGVILNHIVLTSFPSSIHITQPMWMLIIVLYAFFNLGKFWGILSSIFSFLSFSYYILFKFEKTISFISKNTNMNDLIVLLVNTVISISLIVYLINEFLKLNRVAESNYVALTDTLKEKNNEKTVLLKEIHHRVKNNLQVIISLLRLQSYDIEDESQKTPFKETINRVITMSLIHEKIYQTSDLSKIDLKDYIETLSKAIVKSYSVNTVIKLNITSDVTSINTISLVPLALIFNELISNSIKHGFKGKETGIISIAITDIYPKLILEYRDNGKWQENKQPSSLGLELIDSLTEQLSGKFVRTTENGTLYSFVFEYDD